MTYPYLWITPTGKRKMIRNANDEKRMRPGHYAYMARVRCAKKHRINYPAGFTLGY